MRKKEDIILLKNAVEANLLEALLGEEGIPHYIKTYHDPAYDGPFTYKNSWGHVDAPKEYRQRISVILEEIRKAKQDPA